MARPLNFWAGVDPNESSERRVSRFKQWFNRSRIGEIVKGRRYRQRPLTDRLIRKKALMREEYRAEKERNKYYQ